MTLLSIGNLNILNIQGFDNGSFTLVKFVTKTVGDNIGRCDLK
jgi:hypothetical protein